MMKKNNLRAHMHTHTCKHIHTHTHSSTHIHIHMHKNNMHTHASTYTHIHASSAQNQCVLRECVFHYETRFFARGTSEETKVGVCI